MSRPDEFCIIIISHGRPDDVVTLETLRKAGCTLPTYILIDNVDKTAHRYIEKYREKVFIFDKEKYAKKVDNYDNFENYRSTTHARNACFDLADDLGYKYFLVLDDDYTAFCFRINHKLEHPDSCPNMTEGIDDVFLATLDYFKTAPYKSICYSQGGDWFGGDKAFNISKPKRKAMNSFFCAVDRRFDFVSRLNEDVNTYMTEGHRGGVFLTIPFIQLSQRTTQATKGGMSEAYLDAGTYVKSFYTVIARPDVCRVSIMGVSNKRLHHEIKWKNAVPKIIHEKYLKKPELFHT